MAGFRKSFRPYCADFFYRVHIRSVLEILEVASCFTPCKWHTALLTCSLPSSVGRNAFMNRRVNRRRYEPYHPLLIFRASSHREFIGMEILSPVVRKVDRKKICYFDIGSLTYSVDSNTDEKDHNISN